MLVIDVGQTGVRWCIAREESKLDSDEYENRCRNPESAFPAESGLVRAPGCEDRRRIPTDDVARAPPGHDDPTLPDSEPCRHVLDQAGPSRRLSHAIQAT